MNDGGFVSVYREANAEADARRDFVTRTKPKLRPLPGGDFWQCKGLGTLGLGVTARNAWMNWYSAALNNARVVR